LAIRIQKTQPIINTNKYRRAKACLGSANAKKQTIIKNDIMAHFPQRKENVLNIIFSSAKINKKNTF
jgi:hypothetical protein